MLTADSRAAAAQFGPGEMQQHGFARNVAWEVASTSADLQPDERDPCVELVLSPSDYSKDMFPYKFKLVYSVTLHGPQLQTDYRCAARVASARPAWPWPDAFPWALHARGLLHRPCVGGVVDMDRSGHGRDCARGHRVINEDDKPFDFTAALHSYFEVAGLGNASVRGLKGLTYLDKSEDPKNPKEAQEEREKVTFGDGLVDSVYKDAPEHVELDVGTGAPLARPMLGRQLRPVCGERVA